MDSKDSRKILVLALLITLISGGFTLAADETFKNFYSAFGLEDPDPDLDKVDTRDDKCPATPFNFAVLVQDSKRKKSVVEFSDATKARGSATIYTRLKKINRAAREKNDDVIIQTSTSPTFARGTVKEFILKGSGIVTLDSIGKRMRVVYRSPSKGFAILWISELEGSRKGCSVEEASGGEITPP